MATNTNEVKFTKNVTTKVVGTTLEEPVSDEIFAELSKANQLLVVLAETYTTVVVYVVKYKNGYGLSGNTIDAIAKAMQL